MPSPHTLAAIEGGCTLFAIGSDAATTTECLSCHGEGTGTATKLRQCHPIDVIYPLQATDRLLRPLDEVMRRGVLLPQGEIRCVTCHDGASPWMYSLWLPPGSRAQPAVNPKDPSTYRDTRTVRTPARGSAVSPKPLCLVCHALD